MVVLEYFYCSFNHQPATLLVSSRLIKKGYKMREFKQTKKRPRLFTSYKKNGKKQSAKLVGSVRTRIAQGIKQGKEQLLFK